MEADETPFDFLFVLAIVLLFAYFMYMVNSVT